MGGLRSWRDRRRHRCAQRRLRPEDVLPEWQKTLAAIGGADDVRRFAARALTRLGSGLESMRRGYRVPLAALPEDVKERLEVDGLVGTMRVDFVYPSRGCTPILRCHPLITTLADTMLERTLALSPSEYGDGDPAVLGRVGCWIASVDSRTTVVLLRIRHQLNTIGLRSSDLLVEEATAIAWHGAAQEGILDSNAALSLLALPVLGDPPQVVQEREIGRALPTLTERAGVIARFAEERAQQLLSDHRRVREAAQARGSYSVKPLLPPDIIGMFVLLPRTP